MRVYCSTATALLLGAVPFGAKTRDLPSFLLVTPTGLFILELLPADEPVKQ